MILDRASIFSDPEVIHALTTKFIPLAVDGWYLTRQDDAEGEFYRQVCSQEESRVDVAKKTHNGQGKYVFDASGKLFAFDNHGTERIPRVKKMIKDMLAQFQPPDAPPMDAAKDGRYVRKIPPGALVVNVTAKVLGGYEETRDPLAKIFQNALGQDRLWIRADEAAALVRGELPASLSRRIALYHLVDTTRGIPRLWDAGDLRKLEVSRDQGEIRGSVLLRSEDGPRGYEADALGRVEAKGGQLVRFDVVFKGFFWEEVERHQAQAPRGKFPFVVALTLTDGKSLADQVPPEGARTGIDNYFR